MVEKESGMGNSDWWDIFVGVVRNSYVITTIILLGVVICGLMVLYPKYKDHYSELDEFSKPACRLPVK